MKCLDLNISDDDLHMFNILTCHMFSHPSTLDSDCDSTVTVTSIVNFHVPSNDFFVVELIRIIINFNLFISLMNNFNLGYNLGYHLTLVMSYDQRYVRDPKTNAKQYSNNRLIYTYVISQYSTL